MLGEDEELKNIGVAVGKERAKNTLAEIGITVEETAAGELIIREVNEGTFASLTGMKTGETIVQVDETDLGGMDDLVSALTSTALAEGVRLRLRTSDGHERIVQLKLSK